MVTKKAEQKEAAHTFQPTMDVDDNDEPVIRCARCGKTQREATVECPAEGM